MIEALKDWAKRHWPQLRLRTILMLTLLFGALRPELLADAGPDGRPFRA